MSSYSRWLIGTLLAVIVSGSGPGPLQRAASTPPHTVVVQSLDSIAGASLRSAPTGGGDDDCRGGGGSQTGGNGSQQPRLNC